MIETIDFAKLAVVLAIAAAIAAVALYDVLYGWPLVRRVAALERRCRELEEAAPAAGHDAERPAERVAGAEGRLEERLALLSERLAQLELANQGAAYERAIDLAEQGEDAERLIPLLGLSQGEVDLVRLLHGGRASIA